MTSNETDHDRLIRRWTTQVLGPASVGAGVTILASLIPFVGLLAPAFGGGVASQVGDSADRSGPRVGVASGIIVVLLSLPITFIAVAIAATVSPAATVAVLGLTLVGAAYVIGSSALGGYLADEFLGEQAATETAPSSADAQAGTTTPVQPVDRLKRRYVDGEIDHEEFERRLERLVAAEEGAERSVGETTGPEETNPRTRESAEPARER